MELLPRESDLTTVMMTLSSGIANLSRPADVSLMVVVGTRFVRLWRDYHAKTE